MKLALVTMIAAFAVPVAEMFPNYVRLMPAEVYGSIPPPGPSPILAVYAVAALVIAGSVVFIEAAKLPRWSLTFPLLISILVMANVVGWEFSRHFTVTGRQELFAMTWAMWTSAIASTLTVLGIVGMMLRGSPRPQPQPVYPIPTTPR